MFKEQYERKLKLHGPDHRGTKRAKRQMEERRAEKSIRESRILISGLNRKANESSTKTTEASDSSTSKPAPRSSEDGRDRPR